MKTSLAGSGSLAALLVLLGIAGLTSCGVPPNANNVGKAAAEARFNELVALATQSASSEGNDALYSEVAQRGTKTVARNGVITFAADGLTVAATECSIEDGRYTFRGTPVVKGPKTWMVGDQQTQFILSPSSDHHYKLETRGAVSTPAR